MTTQALIERLARRDRLVVLAALVGVSGLAWLYLVAATGGSDATGGDAAPMAPPASWGAAELAFVFVMWAVMMAGMMTPSAAPMILLYAGLARRERRRGGVLAPAGAFAGGYLVMWAVFSLGATLLQWALHAAELLSPMMQSTSVILGSALLVGAGVYQWTPAKHACLRWCRSPADFLARRWRRGVFGAFRVGAEHGAYCVGCCWGLMCLMFAGGVMSLLWMAGLALLVLLEKVLPYGAAIARASGLGLVAAGLALSLMGTF